MKKVCKIMYIFITILILFSTVYSVNAKDIWGIADRFLETGGEELGTLGESTALLDKIAGLIGENSPTKLKFQELIDFIWGLGLLTIFISTVVLGIKYMLVSPAEKSKIKQATTPYIIGVVIIFGALTIWKFMIFVLDGSL